MKILGSSHLFARRWMVASALAFGALHLWAPAQLFDNLRAFSDRLDLQAEGSPGTEERVGPKGIATADFNGDGHLDLAVSKLNGTVALLIGQGDGAFAPPVVLETQALTLRGIVAADLNGDGLADIAAAGPLDAAVYLFWNEGGERFSAAERLETWPGGRNLVDGDFDGDGVRDLAVAGPRKGLVHYRGVGGGRFEILAELPDLSPRAFNFPKPVYTLLRVPSQDGLRDDLVVTHAKSERLWILSTETEDRSSSVMVGPDWQAPPLGFPESPVVITEFMASSDGAFPDQFGNASDWIELFNRSDSTVNLKDWGLSDLSNRAQPWRFPSVSLDPGEFLVVFASDRDVRTMGNGRYLHADFSLSTEGEKLTLYDPVGEIMQQFPLPFGSRADVETTALADDTPLIIGEIGTAHDRLYADEKGQYFPWIQLINRSGDAVVTNSTWELEHVAFFPDNPGFDFPSRTAQLNALQADPGESMVLLDAAGASPNKVFLGLQESGKLVLHRDGVEVHRITYRELQPRSQTYPRQFVGVSYGINHEGRPRFFDLPSPGAWNHAGEAERGDLELASIGQIEIEKDFPNLFSPDKDPTVKVRLNIDLESDFQLHRVWVSVTHGAEQNFHIMDRETKILGNEIQEVHSYVIPKEIFNDEHTLTLFAQGRDRGSDRDRTFLLGGDVSRTGALSVYKPGGLQALAAVPANSPHAMALGALSKRAASGQLDLITANRDAGTLEIRHGNASAQRFDHAPAQTIRVAGGPRSVKIADLDGDGWNELIVALRNFDRVLTYQNREGTLELHSETPTGVSPREMSVGDYDRNGQPDVAIINRKSNDVSVFTTFPGAKSFAKIDQVYRTDGDVSALKVVDINGDQREDVVQLHRASSQISVRLSDPRGQLGDPQYWAMGELSSAQEVDDINGDGFVDLITADMGRPLSGALTVRLGDGEGGFSERTPFSVPGVGGGLFALVPADFDGDGDVDIAAGYFDCRIGWFEGDGKGSFEFLRNEEFLYEARGMTVADFDQDGDLDLAGLGADGTLKVVESQGNLLHEANSPSKTYKASSKAFGSRDIRAMDINSDGDPDLVIGSGDNVMIYFGEPGMLFSHQAVTTSATDFAIDGLTTGDFTGDGEDDLAVSCRLLSCLTVLQKDAGNNWVPAITVDVPSGGYLASGDLDGDGQLDLVGSGDTLWTALSSRRAETVATTDEVGRREEMVDGVVINEVLAINNDLPLALDEGKHTDWVELYNGSDEPASMAGWSLQMKRSAAPGLSQQVLSFAFPADAVIEAGGHRLVIFSSNSHPWKHDHLHH